MSVKIPYLPEGARAKQLAKQWTPHMTDRIRLWSKGTRISPQYDRSASINGGKFFQKLKTHQNYDQHGVSSDQFNAFLAFMTKVSF